jgi:hypothetical protein
MPNPAIGSFTPDHGARNSQFTMYGTDCGNAPGIVTTPTVQLQVVSWTEETVPSWVEVPGGGFWVQITYQVITVVVNPGMDTGMNSVYLYRQDGAPSNTCGFTVDA